MQKAYGQAQLMLSVLEQHTQLANNLTSKMRSWIEGQRYNAGNKLEQNGWQPQQAVLLKIHMLEQEALFWEKKAE